MDDLHDEIAYLQHVSRKPRLMLNIYMEKGQKIVGCFPPLRSGRARPCQWPAAHGPVGRLYRIKARQKLSAALRLSHHAG